MEENNTINSLEIVDLNNDNKKENESSQHLSSDNKKCTRCKIEKPLNQFRNSPKHKLGKFNYCIECQDSYARQNYEKNREKKIRRALKWNDTHRRKLKSYQQTYRQNNKGGLETATEIIVDKV